MAINRKVFFEHTRKQWFGAPLTTSAVRGMEAILGEWERRGLTDLRWLAYMLATVRGECGSNMLPVREGFSLSDAQARAYVARQGYRYAAVVNGQVYYGRGLVQLTWDYNYKAMGDLLKIDLLHNPDLALDPHIAAQILFEGMIRGTFTGKKLADYLNANLTDYVNARRIINGTDKASTFAAYAQAFHTGLAAAKDATPVAPAPPPVKPPAPSFWASIAAFFKRK